MSEYIKINLHSLALDSILDFDLFMQAKDDRERYILYRGQHLIFEEKHKLNLIDNKVQYLYINNYDIKKYLKYLENNLETSLANEDMPTEKRGQIIYDISKSLMQDLFESPESPEILKRVYKVVDSTVPFIVTNEDAFRNLVKIMSFDYTTYSHSLNVYVLALGLAKRLGIKSLESIHIVGLGALLHDVGKSRVPKEILMKHGKLNEEEWKIVKIHPLHGVDILSNSIKISEESLDIVKHHHENYKGNGYPDGLKGEEIPLYSRIVKICDVFDALTTNRPYKNAIQSYPAFKIMKEEMGDEFDTDILNEFIKLI